MKLRSQLIVAFFLLAVLPLSAVTVYSYQASSQALRRAAEAESGRMAEELENRMAAATADLGRKIDALQAIPPPELGPASEAAGTLPNADYIGRLLGSLGEAAEYLESLELEPAPAPAAAPPEPPAAPVAIELPNVVEEVTRAFRASAGSAGGEKRIHPEQLERWIRQVTSRIDPNARLGAKSWTIKLRSGQPHATPAAVGDPGAPGFRLNREFGCDVRQGDRSVGRLRAMVASDRLVGEVLSKSSLQAGEIPFAVDPKGNVYTPDPEDLPTIRAIPLLAGGVPAPGAAPDDWVVVTRDDDSSGLVLGLAHPVGDSLREIRRTSVRNLVLGLGMAFVALLGILPLSHRITRNLIDVTRGADRLAAGNLDAQVPVRSRDEFGQLARSFNQMADKLKENQQRLIEQERLRKELEMCRRIQSELLPRAPMRFPFAEIQGVSIPARELGGDFFNYFELAGGTIALLMGDVSGKGVPAALLMANLQATLRARLPVERDLAVFAADLDREVESSTAAQVYLTLFLSVLDPERRELRFVNAGHQVPFLVRRGGPIEQLGPTGRPIGLLSGGGYREGTVTVRPGDCLFLYTDGLVDAENASGSTFGMDRLSDVLATAAGEAPDALLARVETAVRTHRGGVEAPDDAAMMVLRIADLA